MELLNFPFSGIVGQEAMKTALLLNAVDPSIGGVLIKGQKGTAKSTAVRSLAALLPPLTAIDGCCYHCAPDQPASMCGECHDRFEQGQIGEECSLAMPLVELPLGATEDRVVGTIELQETLRTGERHFEAGLLAAANRGILYVDEVNLLEDAFEKINTGKETVASIYPDLDAAYGDYLCEFEFPGPAAGNMLFEAFKKNFRTPDKY